MSINDFSLSDLILYQALSDITNIIANWKEIGLIH